MSGLINNPNDDKLPNNVSQDVIRNQYNYEGGIVNNLVNVGKYCSNLGFNVAYVSTFVGFGLLKTVVSITASNLTDIAVGDAWSATAIVNGVSSSVAIAEAVTTIALLVGHAATSLSLRATDHILEKSGIAEQAEILVWGSVEALTPAALIEYKEAISIICTMVNTFTVPMKHIPLSNIRLCLVKYAVLQQSCRDILYPIITRPKYTNIRPLNISRSMGFAFLAYGETMMNVMEYIPKLGLPGIHYKDMFEILVPGTTVQDIIQQSDISKPKSTLYQPGYMIIIDSVMKNIVVTIRGTVNMNDVVVDLTCEPTVCNELYSNTEYDPQRLDYMDDGDVRVHPGMYLCAVTLDHMLRNTITELLNVDIYNDYHILCVGHSLGAGVASLLTIRWYI